MSVFFASPNALTGTLQTVPRPIRIHVVRSDVVRRLKVLDIDRTPGTALDQVRQKGYEDKYRGAGADIYLIGMEFDRKERNVIRFEWARG
jgi:hypothetical protein